MSDRTWWERAVRLRALALLAPAGLPAQPATSAAERAVAWGEHTALANDSRFRGLAWRPAGPVKIGVLVEKVAGREKLFIHPKLMRLLTRDANEFARYV